MQFCYQQLPPCMILCASIHIGKGGEKGTGRNVKHLRESYLSYLHLQKKKVPKPLKSITFQIERSCGDFVYFWNSITVQEMVCFELPLRWINGSVITRKIMHFRPKWGEIILPIICNRSMFLRKKP